MAKTHPKETAKVQQSLRLGKNIGKNIHSSSLEYTDVLPVLPRYKISSVIEYYN